jgi:hypothetical protein
MVTRFLVILFSLCTVVLAQNIPGAFGIDFGTHIKDIDVVDTSRTSGGIPIYIVLPPHKVPFLNTYAVEITPKSKRVYAIWGRGEVSSEEECAKLVEEVASQMEKEFGVKRKKPPFKATGYYFTDGNRFAIVKCLGGEKGWRIYLQFYDGKLENVARKEWQEIKAK